MNIIFGSFDVELRLREGLKLEGWSKSTEEEDFLFQINVEESETLRLV
jgi:hypothetical protein